VRTFPFSGIRTGIGQIPKSDQPISINRKWIHATEKTVSPGIEKRKKAMKISTPLANENGSMMVISIVILMLLSVMGIAVTTTTSIELQIAGNDKVYKNNFYQAEGAAMMLAQILEYMVQTDVNKLKADPPQFKNPGSSPPYVSMPVKGKTGDIDILNMLKDDYWEGAYACEAPGFKINYDDPPNPKFIARYNGIAPGSSLDMTTGDSLQDYFIFGRQKYNNSATVIALGYKNRF
jgi:hypothetical protein